MSLKHKVCINISRKNADPEPIMRGGQKTIRSRLLNFLFGEKVGVFVLTPGQSVELVEIRELPEGGDDDG